MKILPTFACEFGSELFQCQKSVFEAKPLYFNNIFIRTQ